MYFKPAIGIIPQFIQRRDIESMVLYTGKNMCETYKQALEKTGFGAWVDYRALTCTVRYYKPHERKVKMEILKTKKCT